MGEGDEGTVKMQGEDLKGVKEFKYLGSTVQKDGGAEKVAKRVQAGWGGAWRKITRVMCDGRVSAKMKERLYKMIVRPAMLYGMEAVAVTKRQEDRIEVAEMKISEIFAGEDKIGPELGMKDIRKKVSVGELSGKLRETRLRWLGHVVRRNEEYVGRKMRR